VARRIVLGLRSINFRRGFKNALITQPSQNSFAFDVLFDAILYLAAIALPQTGPQQYKSQVRLSNSA
jgi:hypothetical protein